MGKRNIVLNIVVFLCFSCLVVVAVYIFNLWFPNRFYEVWGVHVRAIPELFFMEGIITILLGLLLFLGRGGINRWTVEAMFMSSIADWIYGREREKERVKPSELFRADRWVPKGFPRLGLILLFSGVFMILIYFLSL